MEAGFVWQPPLPSHLSAAAVFSAPFCALPSLENRDNLPIAARLRALSPWIHAFPAGCQFLFACVRICVIRARVCVCARSLLLCRPLCLASPPPTLLCILIVGALALLLCARVARRGQLPTPRSRVYAALSLSLSPLFQTSRVSTNPPCSFRGNPWCFSRNERAFARVSTDES